MSFNTFCNICLMEENIIKLCEEENESIFNILISFTSCPDIVNGIIYLCINCCNKLEEYNKFRELYLTNFVRFRYLYNEHKKQLEIRNEPDIERQLKIFVDINVERPNGTPLIENYEAAQALRNNTDITCKESDGEFFKVEWDDSLHKNDVSHADTCSFSLENNVSKNETQTCYVKYETDYCNENQENNHESSVVVAKTNSDRMEESHHQLVSDTVLNVIPCHQSPDDVFDVSNSVENCITDDCTDKEGTTDKENKTTTCETVCNVCEKRFTCSSDLEVHMRTHTNKKLYTCDVCNKTLANSSNLRVHKRTHTDERPYLCDMCGLQFKRRDYIKAHKRTHTDERPYSCNECHKSFKKCTSLVIHKRSHSGERPYSCDECNKAFPQSTTLIVHKRIHSGEKPYKCDECGLGFILRSYLNRHKLKHTANTQSK